jgi:hypothetical protein
VRGADQRGSCGPASCTQPYRRRRNNGRGAAVAAGAHDAGARAAACAHIRRRCSRSPVGSASCQNRCTTAAWGGGGMAEAVPGRKRRGGAQPLSACGQCRLAAAPHRAALGRDFAEPTAPAEEARAAEVHGGTRMLSLPAVGGKRRTGAPPAPGQPRSPRTHHPNTVHWPARHLHKEQGKQRLGSTAETRRSTAGWAGIPGRGSGLRQLQHPPLPLRIARAVGVGAALDACSRVVWAPLACNAMRGALQVGRSVLPAGCAI